jgi:hypothetical protein
MKKTNYRIGVTITINWPLHMDSSKQLVVMFPSRNSRIWCFNYGDNYHVVTKFLGKILMECNQSMMILINTISSSIVFVCVRVVVMLTIPILHR